jgi:FKBP-type peptidyl-prolyl cis-trans isomerase (trigger factor)
MRKLSLEDERIILAQRITRAGLKRLKRKKLPIPTAALQMEKARLVRQFERQFEGSAIDAREEPA